MALHSPQSRELSWCRTMMISALFGRPRSGPKEINDLGEVYLFDRWVEFGGHPLVQVLRSYNSLILNK